MSLSINLNAIKKWKELFSGDIDFVTTGQWIEPTTKIIPSYVTEILINFGEYLTSDTTPTGEYFLIPKVLFDDYPVVADTQTDTLENGILAVAANTGGTLVDFCRTSSGGISRRDCLIGKRDTGTILIAGLNTGEDAYRMKIWYR